jgi:hypothetical protein
MFTCPPPLVFCVVGVERTVVVVDGVVARGDVLLGVDALVVTGRTVAVAVAGRTTGDVLAGTAAAPVPVVMGVTVMSVTAVAITGPGAPLDNARVSVGFFYRLP